ncbi:MAG: type II toxin-antitoxin system RelE/ParE family toxin [Pseudomonadota bacterium]
MIKSFSCTDTEALHRRGIVHRKHQAFVKVAKRKLAMLHAAHDANDLRVPPGNRLEKLSGDRAGQYSIRINDQYRICFRWNEGAEDVEICDYH